MILRCQGVAKYFGGVRAVDGVDLEVAQGETVGLVGPNGSGKTTLLSLIAGSLTPTAGKIEFKGQDITRLSPHRRAKLGIARTFQVPRPLASGTVLENVAVPGMFGRDSHSRSDAISQAERVLDQVGLLRHAHRRPRDLTLHERKFLEIARALALGPELLLLDEVLGGLNPTEAAAGADLIASLGQSGLSVIYIEHNVKTVTRLADRMYVLNRGQNLAQGTPDEVVRDDKVITAYLGDDDA